MQTTTSKSRSERLLKVTLVIWTLAFVGVIITGLVEPGSWVQDICLWIGIGGSAFLGLIALVELGKEILAAHRNSRSHSRLR